jgi:hypothetical protein
LEVQGLVGVLNLGQICKENRKKWSGVEERQIEQERKKLYVLAANLGISHPVVLKQSKYLDKLICSVMK